MGDGDIEKATLSVLQPHVLERSVFVEIEAM